MSSIIESIERRQLRQIPRFQAGDRVRVHFQVIEGTRRRTQVFEGVVIKRQGAGARETFTVRKQSFGVGVERTFPVHTPKIEKLEVAARGDVRRAKLYYLRGRIGKRARVTERRWTGEEEEIVGAEMFDADGATPEDTVAEVPAVAEDAEETAGTETAAAEEAPESDGDTAEAPAEEAPEAETAEAPAEEVTEAEADTAEEAPEAEVDTAEPVAEEAPEEAGADAPESGSEGEAEVAAEAAEADSEEAKD